MLSGGGEKGALSALRAELREAERSRDRAVRDRDDAYRKLAVAVARSEALAALVREALDRSVVVAMRRWRDRARALLEAGGR